MKKVVSIVALAVMAGVSSFAELPPFPMQKEVGFDGLFGVKFGERMPSNVAVTPSPDEDGEQIFKASAMPFPNSMRFIEVHCLRDVDDKVFQVRIKAYDQSLLDALDSEMKLLKREKDDEAALDAL